MTKLSRVFVGLALSLLGCDSEGNDEGAQDTSETETESGGETETESGETEGLITNGCGTFDPNQPNDLVIPQDPDDPEILTACTALCDAQLAGIADCTTSSEMCLMACKMRSCEVCPGTLAPLAECETSMFVSEGCTCTVEGVSCPVPVGCSDLADQTGFCGG